MESAGAIFGQGFRACRFSFPNSRGASSLRARRRRVSDELAAQRKGAVADPRSHHHYPSRSGYRDLLGWRALGVDHDPLADLYRHLDRLLNDALLDDVWHEVGVFWEGFPGIGPFLLPNGGSCGTIVRV